MLAVLASAGAIMATGASAPARVDARDPPPDSGLPRVVCQRRRLQPTQAIKLKRGAALSITNNDVMPHKLVETSGPAVTITRLKIGMAMGVKGPFVPAMLARMGSSSKVTFTSPASTSSRRRPAAPR